MRWIAPLFLIFSLSAIGQDINGRWVTIDDNTGKKRSVIEIMINSGKASGRIVEIFDPGRRDAKCEKCTGTNKDRPILGMYIFKNLVREGEEWKGEIFDPESGRMYDCKLWLEKGGLMVRGYVAFFYRTQRWIRE